MAAGRHLLKNVSPIDFPGHNGTETLDVAVVDGKVALLGPGVRLDGAEAVDHGGAFLSPAWVDMHTHVYWGGCDIAVWPHEIGLAAGVPILVDAGSAGEGNFNGFREFVVKPAREKIIPFLNVGSIGLVASNRVPEIRVLGDIDIERTMRTVADNRDLIAGMKLRLCSIINPETDVLPLKLAKKLSRVLGLPLMLHIGRSLPLVEEALDMLDAGDILTHCFHGKPASSIVDDPAAFAAAERARNRGVVFDIGHGSASFSYRVGREALSRGLVPETFGSDLHAHNVSGPVWDLSMVLSKMLAIGIDLERVVAGAASAPRRVLGMEPARLEPGAAADFTLFTVEASDLTLPDSLGDVMRVTARVKPKAVLWRGELTPAASRFKD